MTTEELGRSYRTAGWWPDESLDARYLRIAATRPDALAVADDRGHELTQAQLIAAADEMATHLVAAGISRDDLVISIMPNRIEWQVVFLALLRIGVRPMTIPVTTDGDTLTYLCNLARARAVITTSTAGSVALGTMVTEATARSAQSTAVIVVDDLAAVTVVERAVGERTAQPSTFDHVMTTSSTTGKPKAVMHTSNTLAALNQTFAHRFSLHGDSPIFMASPLGHSVGSIHGARLSLYVGAPLILQERWDPERAIALIDQYGCEFTAAATPFLKDLIDAPTGDTPKLAPMRAFLCGGAAVPPLLLDQADEQFPQTFVSVLWGMTEGGVTTCRFGTSPALRRTSAGCGLPGLELSVIDECGQHRPLGEEGELVMRGPGVFVGYLGQDDLYRDSLTSEAFFRTGDLARIDDTGYLHLTGRLKDIIIRGGVNISPVPIEDVLAAHPGVRRVAVVGQPDERLGERLCAVIVPAAGHVVTLESLVDWSGQHGLSRRYWPESMEVVDEMPQTAAGKIRKNQLRDELFGGTK